MTAMENAEPLPDGTPQIDDVNQSLVDTLWKTHDVFYRFWLYGSFALMFIIAGLLIVYDPNSTSSTQNDGSLILALLPLIVPVWINLYYTQKLQNEMMVQIAQSLGYQFSKTMSLDGFSGRIFSIGYGQRAADCMSGVYKSFPFRIFTFYYTTGYGKSAQTHINTVFALVYPKPMLHIVLNPPGSMLANELELSDVERVELEGGFSDTCKLYVAKGKQMEAREIFQPDVMQEILASFASTTLEISGNGVYLMRTGSFSNRKAFLDLVALVDGLMDKLLPGLASIGSDESSTAPAPLNQV